MKAITLFIFSIILSAKSFAQTFKYSESNKEEIVSNNIKSKNGKIIRLESTQVPTFKRYKLRLLLVDNDLKEIDKVKIEVEDGISLYGSSLLEMNDILYLFYWSR